MHPKSNEIASTTTDRKPTDYQLTLTRLPTGLPTENLNVGGKLVRVCL